jgi:hypothetical protein
VKPDGILVRLRAQFGDETLSRLWSMSGVRHLKKAGYNLNTHKDYTSFCKLMG